jgi:protein involved in polysaccharide export with SLBB domain
MKPGRIDRFLVTAPLKATAGEKFEVKIEARDAHNNLITDYDRKGRDLRVTTDGIGSIEPLTIRADDFREGIAKVPFIYPVAEPITIIVAEEVTMVSGKSDKIRVKPGPVRHFVVTAPPKAIPGKPFGVRVEAQDAQGNTIFNYNKEGGNLRVTVEGEGKIKPSVIKAESFRKGVVWLDFTYPLAESIIITVKEKTALASGSSNRVAVKSGPLHHFVITAPPEAVAGEPFGVRIEARDAYDNRVVDYDKRGRSLRVSIDGRGKIKPSILRATHFKEGVAGVDFTYLIAEPVSITLSEEVKRISNSSDPIGIKPASVHRFAVTCSPRAVAGEPFEVRIEAQDAYNNTIVDYDKVGKELIIRTDGEGIINPWRVKPSKFKEGIGEIRCTYNKTGRIVLRVEAKEERKSGLSNDLIVTPGEVDHFRVIAPVEATAGSAFKVKIEARDAYDNLIVDYNRRGQEGVAEVFFTYNKADAFSIIASERKGVLEEEESPEVSPEVKVKRKEKITEEKEREIQRYLRQTSRDIRRGKYGKARESLEKALRLDPYNPEARELLERLEEKTGPEESPRAEVILSDFERMIQRSFPRGEYIIRRGDLLEISIWDLEDIGKATIKEVIVYPDGRIALPFVGALKANGLTLPQLTAKINRALSRFIKNPQAAVVLKKERGNRIFIIGEVLKQGFYNVGSGSRLLEVIALSGGPTPRAGLNKVRLVRRSKAIPVNLNKILRKGDMRKNVVLADGDVIFVPEKKATLFSINRLIRALTPVVDIYGKGQAIYIASRRMELGEEAHDWAAEQQEWAGKEHEWTGEEHEWREERREWDKRWYDRDELRWEWEKRRFEWDEEDRP